MGIPPSWIHLNLIDLPKAPHWEWGLQHESGGARSVHYNGHHCQAVYKAVNDIVSIGGYFTACYIIEDRAAWRSIRESCEGFFVCLSPNPQDPI